MRLRRPKKTIKKTKEEIKEYQRNYFIEYYDKNKIHIQNKKKSYNKEYKLKNKEKYRIYQNKYRKNRYYNDPIFRLSWNIRSLIRDSFKRSGYTKYSRTHQILGCSFEYLLEHIQKQFQPWMSWDNQGKYNGEFEYGWDIDHIEPLFPEGVNRSEEDILRLNHYTNLQPLCSKINRDIKINNIIKND